MTFEESILNIKEQLAFKPRIINKERLKKADSFVLTGMGGSALAGGIVKSFVPAIPLTVHRDYGLPEKAKKSLVIISSYSGNTEEAIDSLKTASRKKLNKIIISKNGKLIKTAIKNNFPYIKLPETEIQPRMALGFSVRALLEIVNRNAVKELEKAGERLNPLSFKKRGESLAKKISDSIPVIYSSRKNFEIAYNFKIKFNENAKSPAFCNRIPELNHNEILSFNSKTKKFSNNIVFIFLKDKDTHPQNRKRMEATEKIYKNEGYRTISIEIKGENFFDKYFSTSSLADWTTFFLAKSYGFDPETVPAVEKFKKMIS